MDEKDGASGVAMAIPVILFSISKGKEVIYSAEN